MDSDFNKSHGQMYMAGERGNHLGHQKALAPHPMWQVHSRWEEFKWIKTGRNICSTQNLKYALLVHLARTGHKASKFSPQNVHQQQTWVLKFTSTEEPNDNRSTIFWLHKMIQKKYFEKEEKVWHNHNKNGKISQKPFDSRKCNTSKNKADTLQFLILKVCSIPCIHITASVSYTNIC